MRSILLVLALAVVPWVARAQRQAWPFVPANQEEAAQAASSPIVPVRSLKLRPSYLDIRSGGNATALVIRSDLPMQYALIPGIRIPGVYTIVRIELPLISLNTPNAKAAGTGDLSAFDVAIVEFPHGAVAFGLTLVLPSATSALLGFGKLQLGPAAGAAIRATRHLTLLTLAANNFSVAGAAEGPPIDVLIVQPIIVYNLPAATFLTFDPLWTFDWNRGGYATIRVNLAVGHAFTKQLVASIEPDWVVTGDGKNDVRILGEANYLAW